MRRILTAIMLAMMGATPVSAQDTSAGAALKVVATIQPIHSLAAAVMDGAGSPQLLVKGAASEHTFSLRPSDARVLSGADIVLRVSENLETFLEKPIESLSKNARIVTLADIPGMKLLPVREGGTFDAHAHEEHGHDDDHDHDKKEHAHEEAGDAHGEYDPHLWLSPANAALIADHLAAVFGEARPGQAALFKANAEKLKSKLSELDAALRPRLEALKGKDFIVFHDAYHYFEDHFGIEAAGSITLGPQNQPGAARIKEIRARIGESKAACVFSEPQFEPKLVATVTEGSKAKTGVLDGLGAGLEPGGELYFQLLTGLTENLEGCLAEPKS